MSIRRSVEWTCNRCSRTTDFDEATSAWVYVSPMHPNRPGLAFYDLHLCGDCAGDFKAWMEDKTNE